MPGARGWGRRPQGVPRFNPGSPMAYGLELGLVCYGGARASDPLRRAAWTANGTINTRATPTAGLGADLTGTTTYFSAAYSDTPFISANGITIIWRGVVDTGSTYRHFAGKHASNGASNNPFDFRTDNSTTPIPTLVRSSVTGSRSWKALTVTLGTFAVYAVKAPTDLIETAPTFFLNGTSAVGTTGDSFTGTVTGSSAAIRVGDRADDFLGMDGYCADVWFFNRAIPDAQIQMFSDPRTMWDLYWVPSRRVYGFVSTPPPGGFLSRLTLLRAG